MPDAAFDTLAAAETIGEAGIEQAHAKAVVRDGRAGPATKNNIGRLEDRMATKSDVAELRAEIAGVEARGSGYGGGGGIRTHGTQSAQRFSRPPRSTAPAPLRGGSRERLGR